MIKHLARRFRQWLRRPELPVGDVAGAAWSDVGPLPPASLMPVEEPGLIPLDLPAPPPLPVDARPPRSRDELEWEAVLARMLSRPAPAPAAPIAASDPTPVDPDPTPTAPVVTRVQPRLAPGPTDVSSIDPTPAGTIDPAEDRGLDRGDEGDWETLILDTKARLGAPPARPAGTLVRTPAPVRLSAVMRDPGSEDRAWEQLIARARRRTPAQPAAPQRRRTLDTGDTSDWSAVIAAAKLRH